MRWTFRWIICILNLWLLASCAPAAQSIEHSLTQAPSVVPPTADVFIGEVLDPPVALQNFTLPSSTGSDVSLFDLNGRWRVLFIGYLHCPDFCPLTLSEFRRVKQFMGSMGEEVTFIYLSVDGARDTPEALRAYLDNFDPTFIGFSGDDETLARIQPDYGFYYRRRLLSGSQAIYTIDHSTRSYLIDPEGRLRTTFTYDVEPQAIAQAIQWYMQFSVDRE
jgi:protein SCO1